eukprot:4473932-Amphidinium_carterae.1
MFSKRDSKTIASPLSQCSCNDVSIALFVNWELSKVSRNIYAAMCSGGSDYVGSAIARTTVLLDPLSREPPCPSKTDTDTD